MIKIFTELKSFLKSLFCFLIALLLVPVLFLTFVYVHYGNELLNYVLSIKYPALTISKSKKIRTLIDTQRNAGIFHFLLQVNGSCDFERIKRYYSEHLTDVREKTGLLRFPRLRQKLVTCWGHYAWVNDSSAFNINNQVVLSSATYRGRAVNDGNIQEFVSDLVTKYIPSDLPQWQGDHFYILIKVHHLIIAEEEDLHISELLMLQKDKPKQTISLEVLDKTVAVQRSDNCSSFIRKPVHIQNLLNHISSFVVNRWNAFIYKYESLDTPDGYRCVQITNITQLLSVLLIIAFNVCTDYWKIIKAKTKIRRRMRRHKDAPKKFVTFTSLLRKEIDQRKISSEVVFNAVLYSLHPANVTKTWTKFLWHLNVNNIFLLPYNLYCEALACRDILFKGHTTHTSTLCGRLSFYFPMVIYAQIEFLKICYEIFKAPVNIYEQLFEHSSKEENILQMKSYSGRKIVSFSKSINADQLRQRLSLNNDLQESDFTLSCLAGAIRDYFELYEQHTAIPGKLNTTCRTIGKGFFTDNSGGKTDHIGGIVLLQLPLQVPGPELVEQVHSIVEEIRRKQIFIYLASMGQTKFDLLTSLVPRVLTKICINFFSHNFPVTLTQIYGASSDFKTVWGQRVEDVLLFRPPQSKTCLSLNIHRFGDKYRLAVMADTQLGPDHSQISRSFESYMENLTL